MSVKTFRYKQTTPSKTWIVYHAFGVTPTYDIAVEENGSMQKAYPESVVHTSPNSFTITWTSPRAGYVSVTATL